MRRPQPSEASLQEGTTQSTSNNTTRTHVSEEIMKISTIST